MSHFITIESDLKQDGASDWTIWRKQMGGKAFKRMGLESERMDQETFDRLEREICFMQPEGVSFVVPGNVREKASHGDIDVLWAVLEGDEPDFNSMFQDHPRFRNGGQLHVLYNGKYQIDFTRVKVGHLDFNLHYFSNNDLGNILGRMLKRRGFTLKNDGIYYIFREGGQHVKIPVFCSADWGDVLDILELDRHSYASGFDTFEQMFEWVYSSPYFDASIFQYENLNSENRRRDRVRPTYNKWLDFCTAKPVKPIKKSVKKPEEIFPHLAKEIDGLRQSAELDRQYRQRINGRVVGEITKLSGKELGQVMAMISKYPKRFLVDTSDDVIYKVIVDCWKEWEQNCEN